MTKEKLLLDSRFGEGLHLSKSKHNPSASLWDFASLNPPLSDTFNPCKEKKPKTEEEKLAEKGWIMLK